jgi:hypothetical protein
MDSFHFQPSSNQRKKPTHPYRHRRFKTGTRKNIAFEPPLHRLQPDPISNPRHPFSGPRQELHVSETVQVEKVTDVAAQMEDHVEPSARRAESSRS